MILSSSLALLSNSWGVIRSTPSLVVFPLLSGAASMLVFAASALPFACNPQWFVGVADDGRIEFTRPNFALAVATFLFYFLSSFVITYFNAALASCVLLHFAGETPTVEKGLRAAGNCLPQILGWSLLAGSVGMVLKYVEKQDGIGRLVAGFLGAGWVVVTYFVVPVLVVERVGPIDALKRSVTLLKGTWKEGLVGQAGLGLLTGLFWAGGALLFLGATAVALKYDAFLLALICFVLLVIFTVMAVAFVSALTSVFRCALYQYARTGQIPGGFDEATIVAAFGSGAKGLLS